MPGGYDIAEIASPRIHRLYAYWVDRRGERSMPRREDIDPAQLKLLLPDLIISELEPAPLRIRYRLVGTRVAEVTGLDYTGLYLDEVDFGKGDEEDWLAQYVWIFAQRAPIFGKSSASSRQGDRKVEYEYTILPLTGDGVTVHQCLELEDFSLLDPLIVPLLEPAFRIEPRPSGSDGESDPASVGLAEPQTLPI
jgi:hypothetical protein